MAVQTVESNVQPLQRSFRVARHRFWWQRSILLATRGACAALGFAFSAALMTAWQAPEAVRIGLWIGSALAILAGLAVAIVTRPSASQAARVVDVRLGLRQQLGTAEELLARGIDGGLASVQLARAEAMARELHVSRAFPLVPKRELGLASLLAAATLSILVLVWLGVTIPNPFSVIRLPSFSLGEDSPIQERSFGSRREQDALRSRSPAMEPVRQMLGEIQRQSQQGSLSPAAAAAALAQANAELNRIANESRIRHQALENLANELRSTAAGREAAESLRQGDYDRAAEQLSEIGRQSDQLSAAAKQELAESLNRAAMRSQGAQKLSDSETKAAQAMQEGDYSSVVESMDELAESVQDAANEMVPQSELAEAWQQLEEMSEQFGDLKAQDSSDRGQLSPPVAQAPQAAGERRGNLQQGAPGDRQAGNSGPGGEQPGAQGNEPSLGNQPGNSRGGPPLGNPNQRLGPDGKPLDIEGQIGDRFPGEPGSDPQSPSVLREGKANSDSSSSGGGSEGPISVPSENVFVPGERRSIVRDYFTRGSGGQ